MAPDFEVLIVGGSHSGLSAAMALGRLLRTALICDDGRPRNRASQHANNLISQDGLDPEEWRANARRDLSKYDTIKFLNTTVLSIKKTDGYFLAEFASGPSLSFRKVILAYGVKDKLPGVQGFMELWGKSIFHCPFCHGYEFRNRRIGLVANAKFAEHMLPIVRGLTKDLILFTNGDSEITDEFLKILNTNKIELKTDRITSLRYVDDDLQSVVLDGQNEIARDALIVGPTGPVEFVSTLGDELGCEKTEFGFFKVVDMGKTTVDGVFAAGDITTPLHSVLNAAMSGQAAGAKVVMELLNESFNVG